MSVSEGSWWAGGGLRWKGIKPGTQKLQTADLPWSGPAKICKDAKILRGSGVRLAVSKLLWERRAGRLRQAIPLCLSFCLSVLNSPSALIHSHIQFPALSIHQSLHFVSADFILTLTPPHEPAHCSHQGTPPTTHTPHTRSCFPAPHLLTRAPLATCRFLLNRPAKTPILYLIPIVCPAFHLFQLRKSERKPERG